MSWLAAVLSKSAAQRIPPGFIIGWRALLMGAVVGWYVLEKLVGQETVLPHTDEQEDNEHIGLAGQSGRESRDEDQEEDLLLLTDDEEHEAGGQREGPLKVLEDQAWQQLELEFSRGADAETARQAVEVLRLRAHRALLAHSTSDGSYEYE